MDIDADGDLDAVLAQNSFSPQRETGHMDGGLSQVLLNNGKGEFSAIEPQASGIQIPGDAKSLSVADLDADGRPDLVFGMNDSATISYLNRSESKPLAIDLQSKPGNPDAAGAQVWVGKQVREQAAGHSYLSQSGATLYFLPIQAATSASVRWPDGSQSEHPLDAGSERVVLTQP